MWCSRGVARAVLRGSIALRRWCSTGTLCLGLLLVGTAGLAHECNRLTTASDPSDPSDLSDPSDRRPNFLVIMADDCTFSDLPVYGGANAQTPNIDQLARDSLVFQRAYVTSAMCQPCRAELYSGQYPLRNGCAWNHSASRPQTRSMPHYLRERGYRVGLAGKVHVGPAKAFPFDKIRGFDPNCVRDPTHAHDLQPLREFITRKPEQPFCAVVALVEPHVPWVMGDPSKYPPAKIQLPPNIADTQRTRADYARYLAEITYMDLQVGEILNVLETTGNATKTIVLFTSEQGAQFPGCKWTNWDTGLHTALMARWPGKIEPGRTDAIVQYCDVLPTMLDIIGGELPPNVLDGTSFASVLRGESTEHREYAFGMHNNMPEGPAYPIRTVSNGEYRLIVNLRPDDVYIEKHLMGSNGNGRLNNPYWATWVWDAATSERTYELVRRYTHRPAVQLYHTASDPYELENLADDPERSTVRSELNQKLVEWMEAQGDPGVLQDTRQALEAARQGTHLYGVGQSR